MPTDDDVNARMLETVTCDPLVPGVPRRRAAPPGGKMHFSPGGEGGGGAVRTWDLVHIYIYRSTPTQGVPTYKENPYVGVCTGT